MISLPYDTGSLSLHLDPNQFQLLQPPTGHYDDPKNQEQIVAKALANPIDSPLLAELAQGKRKVVIITSDHTRPVPSHITMPILLSEIKSANPNAEITLLISTGMHRPTTQEEMVAKFGQKVLDQVNVVNHSSDKDEEMVFLGTLPSGGELWLNKLAVEADLLIGEGFIEPHFFAGFSGGRKSVLPGVASRKTVLFNHNSQFIDSPYARTGILKNNPIHKDMIWAAEKAELAFILNVVIDSDKQVIHCVAGHPFKAHEAGCDFVGKHTAVQAKPGDIIITTNGGYPLDQNLYQAVKGMTAAEATAKPGAVIIIVSCCREGMGGDFFYHQLADEPSPKETMDKIMATPSEETQPDQWQSQILARILLKHKVIVVADQQVAQQAKDMHMEYAPTIDEALTRARQIKGEEATITVIPDGVGIIVKETA